LQIGHANFGREQVLRPVSDLDRDRRGRRRCASAVSYDSARRCLNPRAPQAVDHDLDRVLGGLGELRHRVDLVHLAVDRTRTKPLARSSTNSSRCSPLRLTTTGARIMSDFARLARERRVDHLRDRHRRELLLRMIGQYGSPTRANSRRR
jgi:hypothetical protein